MPRSFLLRAALPALLAAVAAGGTLRPVGAQAPGATAPSAAVRPMTWLDVQNTRQVGSPTPSPDGRWLLYTLSVPDWKEARRQNDLYVVSTTQGVSSTRRLTYTGDKNETSPEWSRDGKFFVFLSDRDAARDAEREPRAARSPRAARARRTSPRRRRRDGRRLLPALPHAARRRRGAPDHDREGRRLHLRLLEGRRLAGLPLRPGHAGAALRAPRRRARRRRFDRRHPAHAPPERRRPLAPVARFEARLLRHRRHHRRRRAPPAGEAVRRARPQRRGPPLEPLVARPRLAPHDAPHARQQLQRRRLHDLGRRALDRLPRPLAQPLRAEHPRAEHQRRPLPARRRERRRGAADEEHGDRRELGLLLPRQPPGRLLRARRLHLLPQRQGLPARDRRARPALPEARREPRRRRHAWASGRPTAARSTSTTA